MKIDTHSTNELDLLKIYGITTMYPLFLSSALDAIKV
jgi:hypothetical protein